MVPAVIVLCVALAALFVWAVVSDRRAKRRGQRARDPYEITRNEREVRRSLRAAKHIRSNADAWAWQGPENRKRGR